MPIERCDEVMVQSPEQRMRLQAWSMFLSAYDESIRALRDAMREELTPELERVNREIRLFLGLALSGGIGAISAIVSSTSVADIVVSSAALGAGAGGLLSILSERKELQAQLVVVNGADI